MVKRISIAVLALAFPILLYAIFIMPLPFNSHSWINHTSRPRMAGSVEEMVIGLTRDEIINLLGEPQPFTDGVLHPPSRGIAYILDFRWSRHEFLIIYFDDESIAIETRVTHD